MRKKGKSHLQIYVALRLSTDCRSSSRSRAESQAVA